MKILKHTGKYLEKKANRYKKISIISFLIGIGGILYFYFSIFSNFSNILIYDIWLYSGIYSALIYFSIFLLIAAGISFKNYLNYSGALIAENIVVDSLQELGGTYYLLNDIKFSDTYGNIDHILLGPNGIFVIETKNYTGKVICKGDEWIRHYEGGMKISMKGRPYWVEDRYYDLKSPSKQVKRNAVKIKYIIEDSNIFKKGLKIWVEGIIVFTNPNVDLQLTNTTVPILRVSQLYDYVKNKKSIHKFSSQELEFIAKSIVGRAETD